MAVEIMSILQVIEWKRGDGPNDVPDWETYKHYQSDSHEKQQEALVIH
jgi:hypothetical protein